MASDKPSNALAGIYTGNSVNFCDDYHCPEHSAGTTGQGAPTMDLDTLLTVQVRFDPPNPPPPPPPKPPFELYADHPATIHDAHLLYNPEDPAIVRDTTKYAEKGWKCYRGTEVGRWWWRERDGTSFVERTRGLWRAYFNPNDGRLFWQNSKNESDWFYSGQIVAIPAHGHWSNDFGIGRIEASASSTQNENVYEGAYHKGARLGPAPDEQAQDVREQDDKVFAHGAPP